ncbi:MAG TPA: replication protein [Bacteroidales bacterium]|nr:replication protein [Bacteroidales bacterium]
MANPQKEKGYTAIANEIMEALCRIRIPGEARQVLDTVLRKTYGFGKKEDRISLSQFCLSTGLSKVSVCKSQKKLQLMNVVHITQKGNDIIKTFSINKNFDTWKPLPKKVTLPKKVMGVTQKGNLPLPKKVHTIVDNTKVDITKENIPKTPEPKKKKKKYSQVVMDLVDIFMDTLEENQRKRDAKKIVNYWDTCDKLIRIDGYKEDEIRTAIINGRNDEFWRGNFLSFNKLRTVNEKLGVKHIDKFISIENPTQNRKQGRVDKNFDGMEDAFK